MTQLDLPFITQAPLHGKTVLARVDFNVTVDGDDQILDASKILENLATINYLRQKKTKIVLFSHRSIVKENGKKIAPSFKELVPQIEKIINCKLRFLSPLELDQAEKEVKQAKHGAVFLFDNTRLHPAEEKLDTQYAKALAKLGDIFVYDAFASYRPEVTTVTLPRYLPTAIGFTMREEIRMLSSIFHKPKRPLIAVIGGAKTEVKVGIVRNFLHFADTIILGGSVANTFLQAWGIDLGGSKVDTEMVSVARELLWMALHSRVALELPHDFMISRVGSSNSIKSVLHTEIKSGFAAYDIGPATRKRYGSIIASSGTVVWNGPMGMYEKEVFRAGTTSILDAIISSKAKKIVGGGDTITALPEEKRKKIDHISTGGGAMLVFLESGATPPIEAIRKYSKKNK